MLLKLFIITKLLGLSNWFTNEVMEAILIVFRILLVHIGEKLFKNITIEWRIFCILIFFNNLNISII